jgi:hypothetical protein
VRGADHISAGLKILFRKQNVDFENCVRARALFIETSICNLSLLITFNQVEQCFFKGLDLVLGEVIYDCPALLILSDTQVLSKWIKQIIDTLIIYL